MGVAGLIECERRLVALELLETAEDVLRGPRLVGGNGIVSVAPSAHEGDRSSHRDSDLGVLEPVVEHVDGDGFPRDRLAAIVTTT